MSRKYKYFSIIHNASDRCIDNCRSTGGICWVELARTPALFAIYPKFLWKKRLRFYPFNSYIVLRKANSLKLWNSSCEFSKARDYKLSILDHLSYAWFLLGAKVMFSKNDFDVFMKALEKLCLN